MAYNNIHTTKFRGNTEPIINNIRVNIVKPGTMNIIRTPYTSTTLDQSHKTIIKPN